MTYTTHTITEMTCMHNTNHALIPILIQTTHYSRRKINLYLQETMKLSPIKYTTIMDREIGTKYSVIKIESMILASEIFNRILEMLLAVR